MSRKTVLVPIYKDTPVNALEPFFESARSDDLHLNLVVVGIAPPTPVYAYGYPPYGAIAFPEEWQKTLEEINSDTGGKVEEIEKALMDEGVAAEVSKLFCEKSMIDGLIARHALVSDIAVMLEHLRIDMEVYDKILSGILYESPIAVVINPVSLEKLLHPSSVFIAWDGSARAAKAVQQALPLIGENTKVTVGWFDPDRIRGYRYRTIHPVYSISGGFRFYDGNWGDYLDHADFPFGRLLP